MSTEITFICSTDEKEPTFITETRECVFMFEWSTKAACPSQYSVGEECVVREPGSDHLFDLNLLYNPSKDYFMSTETGTSFRLNLCKPLLEPCNGKKNVSVCLEKNGTQFAIGELATEPMYEDGRVNFKLQGEGCKEGENSSTVYIIFMCNHEFVSSGVGPDLFPGGEDCTFYFLWQTNVSCLPYQEYPCKTVDDYGYEYDLSPLSNPSSNHIVHHKTQYGYVTFLLNLCRSIVHGHDAPCPADSGVCLRNLTEPDRRKNYISLGAVVTWRNGKAVPNELKFKNGHLQITYSEGYLCGDPNAHQTYISSTIHFFCDADKDPGPRFWKESNCNYEFEWGTKYACPKGSSDLSPLKEQQWNNCTAINPATKFRFDLTPLSRKEYSVTTANGKKFTLTVCGSSKKCGEGIGACLETDGGIKSVGLANSNLQYISPSLLSLNYVNGSECAPGVKINTLIEFVCEEDPKKYGPIYVEITTNCTYIFLWLTNMVCEEKGSCVASNDTMEISLSPLISTTNNYKVTANGSDFFINVCRPLVPQEGLNCSRGSSACRAVAEPNGLWTHEESLGYGSIKPVIVDGGVALKYLSGSICPGKGFQLSSAFFFTCDPISDIGTPELLDFTEDCQYQFVWKTSVICSDYVKTVHSTSYTLYNDESHESFSLQPLCKDEGHMVEDYALMCSADTILSVTRHYGNEQISYGRLQKVIFSYAENVTRLMFSGGDSCFADGEDSLLFDAEIRLKCIPEEEIGQPAILFTTNCSVVFVWGSKVGCGQNASAVVDGDKKPGVISVPRSHVSTAGVVIGVLLTVVICLLLLYFRKPTNRNWCRNHLCNLLNRRHHGNFHYSRLEATDEASILLASHSDGVESDSDDELLRT
ncbi:cation-independent mannose-6-phosphate receptor [Anabrus simplex]|uniref:cation-independent mannose-6-phosphate receptor n=1 Tax=Anabrus simplex TaxID=316456 RepID=UPI0035A32211